MIGLGKVDVLWFDASVSSQERAGSVPRYQGHVKIDSRDATWFAVSLVDIGDSANWKGTDFDHATMRSDHLKLGRSDATGVPAWLARAARRLGIAWDAPYIRTNLRGKKRELIAAWLAAR